VKNIYRVLAYLVALQVVVQAAAIAYGFFGITHFVDTGGTIDKAFVESGSAHFPGDSGLAIHGMNGSLIVPIFALVFLIFSFFAKIPGGVKWAAITFGLTAVQVALGIFSHILFGLGALHGINAMALFAVAVMAGMRVRRATAFASDAEVVAEPVSVHAGDVHPAS
jgi:hypothetical protein